MAQSSILGAERAPLIPPGRDTDALGASDSSDSGADTRGRLIPSETEQHLDDLRARRAPEDGLQQEIQTADTDTTATGERASAVLGEDLRDGGDISPDQIVSDPNGLLAEDEDPSGTEGADLD